MPLRPPSGRLRYCAHPAELCVRSQSTGRQRAYFSVWSPCSGLELCGAVLPCQCHSWEGNGGAGVVCVRWGHSVLFQWSYVSPSCVRGTTLHNGDFCLLGGGSGGYSVSIISGSPVFATWWGLNAFLWLSVVPSFLFLSSLALSISLCVSLCVALLLACLPTP